MMYPFLAAIITDTWRAQFARPERPVPPEYHDLMMYENPHTYSPQVPATFRGPKWGQR
jgi:hypothetical protein